MTQALRKRVRVQPGGRIEIQDDALPEGAEVEAIVLLTEAGGDGAPTPEAKAPPSLDDLPPLPLDQLAGSVSGPKRTAEEIDRDLRALRDEWD